MMKNPKEGERARRRHEREHPLTQEERFALLNAMYEEVMRLGRLEVGGDRDRMTHKLAMARILNAGV